MRKRFLKYHSQCDIQRILRNTGELLALELPQTFEAYHASASHAVELLKQAGIPNVDKLSFPADGRTAWQDKISPLGWSATIGKLTILAAPGIPAGTVVADYQRHPFHLIKGSCGTAPEGEVVRLLSFEQVRSGSDPRGALVLSSLTQECRCRELASLLDAGARGVVSDFSFNREDAPDGILWNTAFTEHDNWHVNADDREFIAFSVSPATGSLLRQAVASGDVRLLVESDARRFESSIDLVTALIPGRRREEFWLYAHLYEPMANDNSSGVAAAMETARLLMAEGTQDFSLRLLFGMEHYGFVAYAAYRGDRNLHGEVLGACDYDAMCIRNDWGIDLRCSAPGTPFFGNYLLHQMAEELDGVEESPAVQCLDAFPCMYDDDAFLSDRTTGVATIWPIRRGSGLYHNSLQTLGFIEPEALRRACAVNTALVSAFLSPTREMVTQAARHAGRILDKESSRSVGSAREHLECRYVILRQDMTDFCRVFPGDWVKEIWSGVQEKYSHLIQEADDTLPDSPSRRLAESIVPRRMTVGFPFDLAKVPCAERILLPDSVLYGPLANILSDLDGKMTLGAVIRQSEHELCRLFSETEIASLVRAVSYLARYGYLSLT